MGGLASALGNGFSQLFKGWGKGISNAVDNYLVGGAEARKAISDEVRSKFKPIIDRAQRGESRKAANITELGNKLNESKKAFQDAQADWNKKYADALADAKAQRQKEISDYDAKLQGYQTTLDTAEQGKRSIMNQLNQQEATYTPTRTIFTDVNTGDRYLIHPVTGEYKNITQIFKNASQDQQRRIARYIKGFDERLVDNSSGTPKVINAFNKTTFNSYHGNNNIFDAYIDRVGAPKRVDLIDANNQINRANSDLTNWTTNNSKPKDWDDVNDSKAFKSTYEQTNGKLPKEYSFNGQTYSKVKDLEDAYKQAVAREQAGKDIYSNRTSNFITSRDAEIAKRIQDAKDIKKAKLALGAGVGAGALYAGAKAMYGGDDTPDNTDNTNNIDNTDNTYTGEPDPNFNVEKEGQAILKDRQQVDSGFDPDKADALAAAATLAAAAHDTGVEDGNSIESSGDLGNNIGASTGGHTMEDRLYELIKAMKNPYKADAVANYIYSRHGDDPEVQRLGWRGWLNKYYGDSLRSRMGLDPSGYKYMHVSRGL